MSDLISRKAVLKLIEDIKVDKDIPKNYGTLLDIMSVIRNMPTAYDVDKDMEVMEMVDAMVNAMDKVILRSDFGRCALCDNYAKNITIDGINNGCDGNCKHDRDYTEKDVIDWFESQIRWQKREGAVKDE